MENKNKRRLKGTGSVTYLGKGRRKPYVATYNKKSIGTFATANDAAIALLQHRMELEEIFPPYIGDNDKLKNEYAKFIYEFQTKGILDAYVSKDDLEFYNNLFKDRMVAMGSTVVNKNSCAESLVHNAPTFAEIWAIEYERLCEINSYSWKRTMSAAFKNIPSLHEIPINKIKTVELQNAFDERMAKEKCGKSTLRNMLNVCHFVIKYAMKMDYIDKDYTQFVIANPTSQPRKKRKPFTVDEIKLLLSDNAEETKKVLLYIFTGARPIELLEMKRKDIHLDENYMIGGVKTKAGKGRTIPIHPYVKPIVEYFLKTYDGDFLFPKNNNSGYNEYRKEFKKCMEHMKMSNHVEPYDTRYTFSTLAKIYDVNDSARKKIMGHKCNDLTEDIYTHEPKEYLYKEITKIVIS